MIMSQGTPQIVAWPISRIPSHQTDEASQFTLSLWRKYLSELVLKLVYLVSTMGLESR